MIVVSQCLRLCIVDGKGAGAIDQLRRCRRIARTSTSQPRVNEGERCLGNLDAPLRRYVGISHDAQQELERRNFRFRGSTGECCISECRFLVWRTALAATAPFTRFRSSWHCSLPFVVFPITKRSGRSRTTADWLPCAALLQRSRFPPHCLARAPGRTTPFALRPP